MPFYLLLSQDCLAIHGAGAEKFEGPDLRIANG